jgi:hypothetical protein
MRKLFAKLWSDDAGFIVSVELLFVVVILVIGIIAGLAALRTAVVAEYGHLGSSIVQLDPGFEIVSLGSATGSSNGTLIMESPRNGLAIGAANAITSNTTTGFDVVVPDPPIFPVAVSP